MKIVPAIAELRGLWRRSLIAWPDGRRDETTWVNWLQGARLYVDLRQPVGRPDFSGVACLGDLAPAHFGWLAAQEGFAGELCRDGGIFEWRREIDFQPPGVQLDRGRLFLADDMMIEEGADVPYVEHWHREAAAAAPVSALRLFDPVEGCRGLLLRVGGLFMYARARRAELRAGCHLADCVAGAPTVAAAQALLDCDISQGTVASSGWIVRRSSLPFREGRRIDPVLAPGGVLALADITADGRAFARRWTVLEAEGALDAFPSIRHAGGSTQ